MSKVYLLRHGEATLNRTPEIVAGRSTHIPLTPDGLEQRVFAGKWLAAHHIVPEVVVSSPALRAYTTVEGALSAMGSDKEIAIDDRLHEQGHGIMEGRHEREAWTEEVKEAMKANAMDFALPEGESFHDVQRRMREWYYETVQKHPDATILAGSHSVAIRALAGALLNWSYEEILAAPAPNCSLTRIDDHNGKTSVVYVGRSTANE